MRARRSRQEKRRSPHRIGEREGAKEEKEKKRVLAPLFICFSVPGPALCKLGLGRSSVCFTWGSHSGPRTFLCSIFAGFPFQVFQPPPFWTLFPCSNYLTKTLNLGERDLFYNYDPYYREQYHWLNGHEFEQTSGDSEGQGSLECCSHGVDLTERVGHDFVTEHTTV